MDRQLQRIWFHVGDQKKNLVSSFAISPAKWFATNILSH